MLGHELLGRIGRRTTEGRGFEAVVDHQLDAAATGAAIASGTASPSDGLARARAILDRVFDFGNGDSKANAEVHDPKIMIITFIIKKKFLKTFILCDLSWLRCHCENKAGCERRLWRRHRKCVGMSKSGSSATIRRAWA